MSTNNENGINNKEKEESWIKANDEDFEEDNKQELNEDNPLKCSLCKQLFNQS
jgi:hypothetical protein